MQEALLYKQLDTKLMCTACKHYCKIAPNQTGLCGVRQNKDNKLYLLVYGKASAVNTDPVEKKPLFHFLPSSSIFSLGTVGCNFGCNFCQNYDISQVARDLRAQLIREKRQELADVEVGKYGYELPPKKIIEICLENNIPSIAFTYNEPVIFFEYIYDTAKIAKQHGIKIVFVSNGYESEEALMMIHPYLDAMNIDLKAFTNEFYTRICNAQLQPVLETIKHAHKLGIWIEITTLIIPGKNDSDAELKQIAEFITSVDKNMPWHITAFHPDYKMMDIAGTSHQTLVRAHAIGKKAGLTYVYLGNVHDEERASTYCPNCKTRLIRRDWHDISIENFKNGKCVQCSTSIPGVWK